MSTTSDYSLFAGGGRSTAEYGGGGESASGNDKCMQLVCKYFMLFSRCLLTYTLCRDSAYTQMCRENQRTWCTQRCVQRTSVHGVQLYTKMCTENQCTQCARRCVQRTSVHGVHGDMYIEPAYTMYMEICLQGTSEHSVHIDVFSQ